MQDGVYSPSSLARSFIRTLQRYKINSIPPNIFAFIFKKNISLKSCINQNNVLYLHINQNQLIMANVIKDKRTLNQIAKKYHLEFCSIHRYYEGNAYNNSKGETLPNYFAITNKFNVPVRVFKLQYFSGCFNPFLVEVPVNSMVYSKETNEPVFPVYPNPKWDENKFYTR